jgi:PAS domain S-box-containing protein
MPSDMGERYRELIEASPDLVWLVDLSGRITFINGATRVVFGREPEDMIGELFSELVSTEDRERTITAFASVLTAAVDSVNVENAVHGKDGRLVPLLTNVRIVRNAVGDVTGIAGSSRDITALKEAASELERQAEEQRQLAAQLDVQRARLAEAQAVAKVGSWELDLLTDTLTWSDENYRIFEIEKSAFGASYEAFLERVHPDDRALVHRTYVESLANRVAYAIDHRARLPDGRIKIVHERCQTFYDDEGRALRSVGTSQDVTESRLAEAALYESRQALRGVLDSVPQRVFWKDRSSVYLGCNRPFAEDMGFAQPSDVVGKTDDDATWKASAELYRRDDGEVIRSGEARLNYEEPMELADGRKGWLRTSKIPVRGRDGSVVGLIGTYEDITERKRLEAQHQHAQRLQSIGTLAAGMAHEINNPLTYVTGNIEICREWLQSAIVQLRRHIDAPEDTRVCERVLQSLVELEEPLRDATDGAERVRRLVLDIKRMAHTQDTPRAPRDLQGIVETAIKMTAHAVRHSAVLRTSLARTALVEGAEGPLVQVFTSLLLNAADAIGVGRAEANEIMVTSFTDDAGWPCVEVRDTGPGVRPEVLPQIFDPFFTTKRVGSGMGLGLSTSHSIVTSFGGRLTVESPPGSGAVFRVSFPPAAAAATHTAPAGQPTLLQRRGKILVIDDESAVAIAIGRMLRDHHDVTVLTDGREALAMIAAGSSYDLIFCDLMMPNLSGVEVYLLMAETDAKQASKIVFMTGGAFTVGSQDFLDRIGGVHITKPFTTQTIRAIAAACVAPD